MSQLNRVTTHKQNKHLQNYTGTIWSAESFMNQEQPKQDISMSHKTSLESTIKNYQTQDTVEL